MSASLVGSEMCIRDSRSEGPCEPRGGARAHRPADGWQDRRAAVSGLHGVEWPQTRNRLCRTRYP
eukprot:6404572-Alexandrium_andersonii.AAC.1